MAGAGGVNMEQFESYFQRADLDRDGRISGAEAVSFFQGSNLSKQVLAQIWQYADKNSTGYLNRPEFYNALKLVTVAQVEQELTPDIVKAALSGPISSKIPAPWINLPATQPNPSLTSPQNSGFRGQAPSGSGFTNANQQFGLAPSGSGMNQQFGLAPSGSGMNQPLRLVRPSSAGANQQFGLISWPKMTRASVEKYAKIFTEVDADRDGKITGEQARNLFLSWRLPREVLKQAWDLSDQDSNGMLSLREFCIALYFMERYKEGRPLPSALPNSVMTDETLLSLTGPPTAYGTMGWGSTTGFRP